jgi:K+-transporting ATPase ATPase C chain
MRRQLVPAIVMLLAFTVLVGLVYPLVVLGVGQLAFGHRANGSVVEVDGRAVGSELLAQPFTDARYFHPRPSAAGSQGYDTAASGGSNLGPSNPALVNENVPTGVAAYRRENGLAADATVPVDAVTTSASGLDPHISVANARLQAARVALARGVEPAGILHLIDQNTDGPSFGVLGEPGVNVLTLNLALDGTR